MGEETNSLLGSSKHRFRVSSESSSSRNWFPELGEISTLLLIIWWRGELGSDILLCFGKIKCCKALQLDDLFGGTTFSPRRFSIKSSIELLGLRRKLIACDSVNE